MMLIRQSSSWRQVGCARIFALMQKNEKMRHFFAHYCEKIVFFALMRKIKKAKIAMRKRCDNNLLRSGKFFV